MIVEFELVKRKKDIVTKRLIHDEISNSDIGGQYLRYPDEVEELLQEGYTVEHIYLTENALSLDYGLKLYFATFSILKDHEYHASAGYIFAYSEDRAIEMLKKRYGEETRVRSIEELKFEEGTVLYGERWHKL